MNARMPIRSVVRIPRPRDDDGSILPLAVFFGVLALAVVLLVVAATSLYLERERLYTLADGAALAGAEAFDLGDVDLSGASRSGALPGGSALGGSALGGSAADTVPAKPRLHSARVRAAVDHYLAGAAADGFEALTLESAGTRDGASATVRIAATWHPPVISLFVPDGIRLRATSIARSVFVP